MIGVAIYFGVVLILIAGSIRKPAFALGAFLCMFGLEQWGAAKIGFVASHGSFTNYLAIAIIMIAFAVHLIRSRTLRVINGPIHILVILLYSYAVATLLWTPAPDIAAEEWRAQAPYLLLSIVILPLLLQNAEQSMEGLRGTLIAGAILSACLAFLVEWGYRRIESDVSGGDPIMLPLAIAQLGAIVFVLAILYVPWRRSVALVALALVAISIILVLKTGSRGQLVAMLASALLFLPIAKGWSFSRGHTLGMIVVALTVAVAWTAIPGLSDLFALEQEGRFDSDRAVMDYEARMAAATRLLQSYLSSDILGLLFGLGNSASFAPNVAGYYTHIVPVEILCELGVVGFLLFVAIVALSIRAIVRFSAMMASLGAGADTRRVIASLAALSLIELLLSFKEGSLVRDVNLFLFPILIEGVFASTLARARLNRLKEREVARTMPAAGEADVAVGSWQVEKRRGH